MNRAHDLAVAKRAAGGDLAAFGVLVSEHQSGLRRFARRLASDEGDDIAQEAMVKAWRSIGQYRGDAAFGTWLQRIALRLYLDRRRGTPAPNEVDVASPSDPDRKIAVENALQSLPIRERAAAVLVFAEGYSHVEAANVMGVPLGTLKSLVGRARTRLQPLLEGA